MCLTAQEKVITEQVLCGINRKKMNVQNIIALKM